VSRRQLRYSDLSSSALAGSQSNVLKVRQLALRPINRPIAGSTSAFPQISTVVCLSIPCSPGGVVKSRKQKGASSWL